ncbi:hypothetical protein F0L17_06610 [Streptomyces sp. TRM43335]|uniref:Uncharacterized protein n=1 Tax=Streptomyces taklimakanensis TaxID=2569853 RepID=A0A6G2B967_9ACTN|nr:hypothetical protein [Streptomyces taklimakanensis]MTE18811.1 hypothetical protein [Streptomyces taklimakanensis]
MSARRPFRLPEPDGLVAGVVLAAANVLGLGAVAGSAGIAPAVPGALPVTVLDDDAPVSGRGPLPSVGETGRR